MPPQRYNSTYFEFIKLWWDHTLCSLSLGTWSDWKNFPAACLLAKSLQLCPTLCDPIDGSPRGSPIPGILLERTLEWVAICFSNAWKWKVKMKSLSHVQLFGIPWNAAHQASLSISNSWNLLKLMSTESVMLSNHLILCYPLLLLPSIFPSIRGLFQLLGSSHQVVKLLEFLLQQQSFQWIFRVDFP